MKKYYKLIVFILTLGIIFGTYKLFQKNNSKIIYIPLGDSIAEGMNAYSAVDYGYTDYISDYLKKNDRLSFYTKAFTKSGYKTKDVRNDIESNKVIKIDGKKTYLKEILRESDLVTLTIGANDFLGTLNVDNIETKLLDIENTKREADKIALDIKDLLLLIKQYAKRQIIVTGYYNPFPRVTEYKEEIDEVIKYFDYLIEDICDELDVEYVDIFNLFDNNQKALPNPFNIHPNKYGYEIIAKEIIKYIE